MEGIGDSKAPLIYSRMNQYQYLQVSILRMFQKIRI